MSKPVRVGELGFSDAEPGSLWLLRGSVECPYGGSTEYLHVVSVPRGGQVRGYERPAGTIDWQVWHPAYEGDWTEMDLAVCTMVREPIVGMSGLRHVPERVAP
jgi:hypothetical protein